MNLRKNHKQKIATAVASAMMFSALPMKAMADDLSLGDLLSIEAPKVISSSKSEKSLDEAPSVITVYTDKDIQRMGARSVKDLLERTVGFHNGQQYSNAILGNRGIIADGNSAWLLLIDEHNVNSTVMHGMQSQYVFPLLNNVKRIEIVRGPGSTLWGSDAAMGTIHIITKKGTDVKGTQVSADISANEHGAELSQHYGFLQGDASDDGKFSYMTSFDWMSARGFPEGPNLTGINGQSGKYAVPYDSIRDSHQLFSKFNFNNSQLIFRKADLQMSRLWTDCCTTNAKVYNTDEIGFSRTKTTSAEFKHTKNIDANSTLDFKLIGGVKEYNQQFVAPYYNANPTTFSYDVWGHEHEYGTELMYSRKFTEAINSKFGARLIRTEYDPILSGGGNLSAGGQSPDRRLGVVAAPTAINESNGIYGEGDFKVADSTTLTAGARWDSDRVREKGSAVLPRFAAIYKPQDAGYSVKYLYNTGFVRPPVGFGYFGTTPTNPFAISADNGSATTVYLGADKSEKIEAHDLQFTMQGKKTYFAATLYQTSLDNYFLYNGKLIENDTKRLFIVNAGKVTSRGLELEVKHNVAENLNVNGNISYALESKFDSRIVKNGGLASGSYDPGTDNLDYQDEKGNMTGMPQWIGNLGADYALTAEQTVNTNVHFINGGKYRDNDNAANGYKGNGLNATLDASWNYAKKGGYSLTVFTKNLTGNKYRVGTVTAGAHQVQGFTGGVIAKYDF